MTTLSNILKKKYKSIFISVLFLTSVQYTLNAQTYIHPNQAGNAGGNITSPGKGLQVVISTYLGTASNLANGIQGTIFVSDKNGNNKFAITDFAGYPNDGSYPFYTTPQQMSDGNLYGTSYIGGSANLGAVYKYDLSAGAGTCDKTIVHNNSVGSSEQGVGNFANVNELSDGKLYVAYSYGGSGWGQIIRMDKDGTNVQVLKNFLWVSSTVPYTTAAQLNASDGIVPVSASARYDGAHPYGFVTEGADGKIYGTCIRGGTFDHGVVWRMNKNGSNFEIIYASDSRFLYTRPDGSGLPITSGSYGLTIPYGNVAQDQSGRIYLAGYHGGAGNLGGLGRMEPDGSNIQILVSGNTANGAHPYRGPLVIDNEIFGTFRIGGGNSSTGVVWKYNLINNTYTKLKTFENVNGYEDGYDIWAGVAFDGTHLFGTAITGGGAGNVGTLWKIRPNGTDFKVIHRFSSSAGDACGVGKSSLFSYYPSAERVTFANITEDCSQTCIGVPLSIRLGRFDISTKDYIVYLNWTTESEQNNKEFVVERSTDNQIWEEITYIKSKASQGISQATINYHFNDLNPNQGINYYRIKYIDFNQKVEYSVIKMIAINNTNIITVYPNPAMNNVVIDGISNNYTINLIDNKGRILISEQTKSNKHNLNLQHLSAGIYYVQVLNKDKIIVNRKIQKKI